MLAKAVLVREEDISELKAVIAQKLHKKGFTQTKISSLLNITQPMVSKYLSSKEIALNLKEIANKIVDYAVKDKHLDFSYLISSKNIQADEYFISTEEHILTNEKSDVIQSIILALEKIKNKDFSDLLPEVKINIAMTLPKARSRKDIAAVPGGLIFVNNYLQTYIEPEFGASRHLSSILLYAISLNENIRSVINIKYNDKILNSIQKQKLTFSILDTRYKLIGKQKKFDILIHKGSFGIEPIIYIFGKNAEEVIEKCLKLI